MTGMFDLVVRTPGGLLRNVEVRAADAASARASAVRDGLHVLGCTARGGAASARASVGGGGRHRLDVPTFSQELASLIGAGLSVTESLKTLAAKEKAGPRRALLLDVVASVSEGLPLSTALERQSGQFPSLLIATVGASEQTGDLGTALRRYAAHQQDLRVLRDKVTGAAVYPMLLLAVGSVVVLFLLSVVVPKFATLIESTHRELPWTSELLMAWGRLAARHGWLMGGSALALAVAMVTAVRHQWRTGARARWIEELPLIGPTVRQFRHAQMYRTTGMLVEGGIAAPRALQLSSELLGHADRDRLRRAIALIQEGRSMSAALEQSELGDPVATSMLTVAERTGALAQILERIAQFYEGRLQRSIELTSRLFEPALMIVIGLVIGAIVVLMYLPIFDLASSIQ
jgi:general secretion pathway protein F